MKNKIKNAYVTAVGFAARFMWYLLFVIVSFEFYDNYLIGVYADIPDISHDSIFITCALVPFLFETLITFLRNWLYKLKEAEGENMTSEEFKEVINILSDFAKTGMMCLDKRQADLIKKYTENIGNFAKAKPCP